MTFPVASNLPGQYPLDVRPVKLPREITSPDDVRSILETISDQHGFLGATDGTCLFYRAWTPAIQSSPDFAVLVLHGIGLHGGPYKVFGDALNKAGVAVYALDTRGHGLSCGKRDQVPDQLTENRDIRSMIQFLKERHPQAKVFLLGESMGGIFALNYAKENDGNISGLILLAPAVSVARGQFFRIGNIPLLPYLFFCSDKPVVSLVDKRLTKSTRDEQFVIARRKDSLAYEKVSINYLREVGSAAKNWEKLIAPRVKIPTLIVQGEKDPIVSPKGSRRLFELLASTDKQFKPYQNIPHTLPWDPETPDVLETVCKWIIQH